MIKFVIVAALLVVVAGRTVEETKVNDKVAAEKRDTGVEDSAAATRSYNTNKKKPYGTRDYYEDVEYGQGYKVEPYEYEYQVKDDYSYTVEEKHEQKDDSGVVYGHYSVHRPDGFQKVAYTVDHAYNGDYKKDYQAGGKYAYQPSKQAYKKPNY